MASGERELIEVNGDKRYVRRDENGRFKDVVDQGASLSADQRRHSNTKKPRNQGDTGD